MTDRYRRLAGLDTLNAAIATERTEESRALKDAPGKSIDRHVAVFRKKES